MRLIIYAVLAIAFSFPSLVIANDVKMTTFVIKHKAVPGEKGKFIIRTNDPKLIKKARKELAKPVAKRHLMVNGKLGSGDGGFNSRWHWHIEDNMWDLVELSTEVCDGTPEMVEKDVKYWVDNVKRYCPFPSYIFEEVK